MVPPGSRAISLRRELLLQTAILFVAAILVAVTTSAVTLPLLASPAQAALFIGVLIALDLVVLFLFLSRLFHASLFKPIERIGTDAERIARGDLEHRIAAGGPVELDRLALSLNEMAERLISEQQRLSESVASLDRANRDLVAATDDLVRSARMASVGTLAAGLAHEVGNPLGALVGYLEVAEGRAGSGSSVQPILGSAKEEARRIDRIVKSVLAFADPARDRGGIASGPVGPASLSSLADVAARTLSLLEGRGALEGVSVRTELPSDPSLVQGQSQHLEQIVMNLVMNALQASREGRDSPEVVIRIREPSIRRGDHPGYAVLEVSDNGPGFHPEDLARLFDPFFTTRPPGEGTGLGLAITRRIVHELGGTIDAHLQEGGGALFRVVLPEAPAEDIPAPGAEGDGADRGASRDRTMTGGEG